MAKLAGEGYCRSFHHVYGLETVALRYFNVFGPRQDLLSQYASVVPNFITALREGRPLTIYGDGEQSRDFTYVGNVVEANVLAMSAADVSGRVYNIACGKRITVNQLVGELEELMERRHDWYTPRNGRERCGTPWPTSAALAPNWDIRRQPSSGRAYSRRWLMPPPEGRIRVMRVISRLNVGGPAIQAITLTRE